jgi:hypothetical protein
MQHLAGRLSWRTFLSSQLPLFVTLVAALVAAASALLDRPRERFIVSGFALLTGGAAFAWFAMSLTNVARRFEFDGQRLSYALLGRGRRTVPLDDVVAVNGPEPPTRRSRNRRGATVLLRDGRTLFLSFDHLENAEPLAEALRVAASEASRQDDLEGCLDRSAVAAALIAQTLITFLLLAVAAFATMILGAALRNPGLVPNAIVLYLLGGLLLALGAAGFYFGVLRYWIGCVRWFRLSQGVLSYRTAWSRTIRQRLCDDLDLVAAYQPASTCDMAAACRTLRSRDGERIKLHLAELQNAAALYDRLKSEGLRRWRRSERPSLPAMSADDPRSLALQPYLEEGERLYWVGRPVYAKLWSEMAAEVIFGLIPGTFGVAAMAMAALSVRQGEVWGSLFAVLIGAVFLAIGLWCMAAPWRYRRMLRDAIYAVTTRRAIIVNGFIWGRQVAVAKTDEAQQSFDRDAVANFEIIGRGRDLALGGQWRRGRKGASYWAHYGFLAPDDRPAAEAALQCLMAHDAASQ